MSDEWRAERAELRMALESLLVALKRQRQTLWSGLPGPHTLEGYRSQLTQMWTHDRENALRIQRAETALTCEKPPAVGPEASEVDEERQSDRGANRRL